MGALTELIAHGGAAGAIVEAVVVLAVLGVLVAIWLRERGARASTDGDAARLREDDQAR